jgi:hypothetical protein
MKRQNKNLLILSLLGLILFALFPGHVLANSPLRVYAGMNNRWLAQDRQDTTVSLESLPASVSDCGVLELFVDVNDVTDLYGVDFRMSFDPTVIEVVDMNLGGNVNIAPVVDPTNFTTPFKADFTVRNIVDNFRGTIWYAASSTNPTPAAQGSGHVARFQIRAKADGDPNFAFTYIKLSEPGGIEIPATGVIDGGITVSTDVVPDLDITRLDVDTVQLSWPVASTSLVNQYHLYRSTTPYFYPGGTAYQVISNTGSGTLTFDDDVLGNVTDNYFYALRAECTTPSGSLSGPSDQVGKFEFELFETDTTDYSWVGLVLDITPPINLASTLADHIEANSTDVVNVSTVSSFGASGQNLTTYDNVFGFGDFSTILKNAYRIEVDIPDTIVGSVIWAQVGKLPLVTDNTYTLRETDTTDYNWILQPLDMTGISSTKNLANDITNNSSGPVGVLTVASWNGNAQNFSTYDHQLGFGSFSTRFGYPYRVEVNVNIGFSVTWP